MIKEVNSSFPSSSSLLGCGGANADIAFSLGQVQVDGSYGPSSPHCGQVKVFDEGSSWMWDHIIFICKRTRLSKKGREMELLSFLASLESMSNGGN